MLQTKSAIKYTRSFPDTSIAADPSRSFRFASNKGMVNISSQNPTCRSLVWGKEELHKAVMPQGMRFGLAGSTPTPLGSSSSGCAGPGNDEYQMCDCGSRWIRVANLENLKTRLTVSSMKIGFYQRLGQHLVEVLDQNASDSGNLWFSFWRLNRNFRFATVQKVVFIITP